MLADYPFDDPIRQREREARAWAEARIALHPGHPMHPDFDDLDEPVERPWIAHVEDCRA